MLTGMGGVAVAPSSLSLAVTLVIKVVTKIVFVSIEVSRGLTVFVAGDKNDHILYFNKIEPKR